MGLTIIGQRLQMSVYAAHLIGFVCHPLTLTQTHKDRYITQAEFLHDHIQMTDTLK
jgi:hypothetical protein